MKMNEKKVKMWMYIYISLGIILSITLGILSAMNLDKTPPWMVLILLIILGILLSCGIGLLLDLNSRISGFLVLAISLTFGLYLLLFIPGVKYGIDLFSAALLLSAGFAAYFVINKQFDRISDLTKNALKILLIVLLIAFTFNYFISLPMISIDAIIRDYETDKLNLISYIISLGLIVGLYFVLMKNIRGIRASEVFVFGPRASGKTFFLAGMFKQFVTFLAGSSKELIFCGKREEEPLWRLSNLLAEISSGKSLPSNVTDMVAIYSLLGKQYGIRNVDFTIVDYAGEWVHDIQEKINQKSFETSIEQLSAYLNIDKQTLESNIGSVEFLESIKNNNPASVPSIIEPLIIAFIFKRLTTAGKIIFLIDGEKIMNYDTDSKADLIRLFGYYDQIIRLLGTEKQYAFVVTKTDKIFPLYNISQNSREAAEIEERIQEKYLMPLDPFMAIWNNAINTPTYLFAVSANSMNTGNKSPDYLIPWRYDEVARFQF